MVTKRIQTLNDVKKKKVPSKVLLQFIPSAVGTVMPMTAFEEGEMRACSVCLMLGEYLIKVRFPQSLQCEFHLLKSDFGNTHYRHLMEYQCLYVLL